MRSLQNQLIFCARAQQMLIAGALVLVGGFYLFGYRPATVHLHDLRIQIESKQRTLELNRAEAADLPEVAREVEALQYRLKRFDKKLPKHQDVAEFMRDIDRFSQRAALRNLTWNPGAPKRQDLFIELPIMLRFQGDFPSVHAFLRHLEDMPRLTRVRLLQLRNRDTRSGLVDVELSTTVFYLEGS